MVIRRKKSLNKRFASFIFFLIMMFLLNPSVIWAHASLINSVPSPNSVNITSPQQIALTFNERLEDSLYYIKVINEEGKSVTSNKARLNDRRTIVTLALPKLSEGTYVATYHIISADGHPIEGSYLFTIGSSVSDNTFIANGGSQPGHSFTWDMPPHDWLLYISRIFYYMALLILLGWVIWSSFIRKSTDKVHQIFQTWRIGLLRVFIIALIFLVYFHYQELIGDGGAAALLQLFVGTSIGVSWLSSFVLAICGFFVLQRKLWIDLLWVALMVAVKCLNGHAMVFKPLGWTVILDALHISAAAIWVGGLVISIVFWRNKPFMAAWLPRFSRAALNSIIVLTITGSITTWIFLPKLSYLKYSQWGTLLLIKVGLVFCIACTGFWIRRSLKRGLSQWFKADLILMILVVSIVGLLTYTAPIPKNDPFNWHEMGEKAHLTLNINPNVPGGVNTFDVEVWLPSQAGEPKKVELFLKYEDDPSIAPIAIPLQSIVDKSQITGENESFDGFKKYIYKSEGPYLSIAGKWGLVIHIYDSKDDEISFTNEMRVY